MDKTTGSAVMDLDTPKRKRPGVHAKKKNSVHKKGRNYKKKDRGQGTGR